MSLIRRLAVAFRKGDLSMISTKGRYAIRVIIDLAENTDQKVVPLKDIAARQQISKKYLEIIVKDLVAADLIVGVSGKGGGYRLCRKPDEYTIGEILEVMEGTLSSVACLANPSYECSRKDICSTLPLWKEFDQTVRDFFFSRKISDLIKKR